MWYIGFDVFMMGSSFFISNLTNSEVHPAGSGKKTAKPEKLNFIHTQNVTYNFSYFFMESSFLMSDLSNLDFLKIFWRIFQNIFWRFFIIIKSLWNTIKLNDFYNVKQFGGFFKIFWEIFKNYRITSKIQNTKIIGRGAAPLNIPTAAKPPEASGEALAKPLVLYKKASLHSFFSCV